MKRIIGTALTFVAAFGFYLFLAGTVDAVEVTAGLVGAAATAFMTIGMNRVAKRHYAFEAPLRSLVRPLIALVPETFVVGRALITAAVRGTDHMSGDFSRQSFEAGDANEPATRGRRAIVVLAISLAPRTFVVRGETDGPLLLHGLSAKSVSPDMHWPV